MWDEAIWRGRYERYTYDQLVAIMKQGGEHGALAKEIWRRRGREAAVAAGAWPKERLKRSE